MCCCLCQTDAQRFCQLTLNNAGLATLAQHVGAHRMTWLRLREMSTRDRLFSAMLVACTTATKPAVTALRPVQAALSVRHHGLHKAPLTDHHRAG